MDPKILHCFIIFLEKLSFEYFKIRLRMKFSANFTCYLCYK